MFRSSILGPFSEFQLTAKFITSSNDGLRLFSISQEIAYCTMNLSLLHTKVTLYILKIHALMREISMYGVMLSAKIHLYNCGSALFLLFRRHLWLFDGFNREIAKSYLRETKVLRSFFNHEAESSVGPMNEVVWSQRLAYLCLDIASFWPQVISIRMILVIELSRKETFNLN